MKTVIKNFFSLFILVVIFLACYAWINIWIPKNSVGIFYSDISLYQEQRLQPQLIFPETFAWKWQRIVPRKSSLLSVSTHFNTLEQIYSLPLNIQADNAQALETKVDALITIDYRLDHSKLLPFVNSYFNNTIPADGSYVYTSIAEKITTAIALIPDFTVPSSGYSQSVSETQTTSDRNLLKDSIDTHITHYLKSALSSLPIQVHKIQTSQIKVPNIDIHNVTLKQPEILEVLDTKLKQYLYFIERLEYITSKSSNVQKLIELLPPDKIINVLE